MSMTYSYELESSTPLHWIKVAQGDGSNDVFTAWEALDWAFDPVTNIPYTYFQNWKISGGAGNDRLTASSMNDSVNGEGGDDTLFGMGGHDILDGGIGNDWMSGGDGNDRLSGGEGRDLLFGDAGNDELIGDKGADWLDGGKGADHMSGGLHDDTYVVDNPDDVIVEAADIQTNQYRDWHMDEFIVLPGGVDTVVLNLSSYRLPDLVENVRVADGVLYPVNVVGNELDNVMTGSAQNDVLWGLSGNDRLEGGAGLDTLYGGLGDDTYIATDGDVFVEGVNAGTDLVHSFLANYTLPANLENLQIMASGLANATGNELSNKLTGNLASNTLSGLGGDDVIDGLLGDDMLYGGDGNDSMLGNFGNDWLFGDNGNDILDGSFGNDYLYGGSGHDSLYGGDGSDQLIGQDGNDVLLGGAGDDYLVGNAGADHLTGGAGHDLFRLLSLADSRPAARDTVYDFQKGQDRIDLSFIDADAITAGNQAFHFAGYGQPMFTTAGDVWVTEAYGKTSVWAVTDDGSPGLCIDLVGVGLGLAAADFVM